MTKAWHCATTKPGGELLAAENLRAQHYIVYLPKLFRHPNDDDWKKGPFDLRFGGYIFIAFDRAKAEYGPVNNTRGVGELLLAPDGSPQPIPSKIIETLRGIEDQDFDRASTRTPKARPDLREGDHVMIDEKDHRAFGAKGFYLGSSKGTAKVLIGSASWDVSVFGLKKIERAKR